MPKAHTYTPEPAEQQVYEDAAEKLFTSLISHPLTQADQGLQQAQGFSVQLWLPTPIDYWAVGDFQIGEVTAEEVLLHEERFNRLNQWFRDKETGHWDPVIAQVDPEYEGLAPLYFPSCSGCHVMVAGLPGYGYNELMALALACVAGKHPRDVTDKFAVRRLPEHHQQILASLLDG